ncbi:proton-coupled folate transporter-like [Asterias rubens]|uniref:proton-coupled folate transporter-like n=1 Tax=Asterias rubens TaxID=7604 RepID=UPI00145533B3|nr:proton-coupled folate transporter-like [Asterias rubens]XP_033629306.1 proton-coupled folate transporter-like [Asterias rubens]
MKKQDFGGKVVEMEEPDLVTVVNEQVSGNSSEHIDVNVPKTNFCTKLKGLCFRNMKAVRRVSVEPALLVVMISMGLTGGVSMQFVQHRIFENFNISTSDGGGGCDVTANLTEAQKEAQLEFNGFNVISGFVGGIPALFVTLIVSAISDKVGRKLPLLLPIVGMLCGTTVFLLVSHLHLPLTVLLVSNIVFSFTGGYALFFSGCASYVADTTSKKDRTFVFALLFTLSLIGSGIAGIAAGYWIKASGFNPPFWLAFAMQLVTVFYLLFWVPETVKSTEDVLTNKPKPSTASTICQGLSGILNVAAKGRRVWLLLALGVQFLALGVFGAINSILTVRLLSLPFCWNSVLLGYFNATKPFINGLGLTLGTRFFTRCLKDYAVIQIGFLSTIAMLIVICISTETYGMFLVNVAGCFHALPPALIIARMSKLIEPSLQGALFSLTGTIESLANILGPFILGLIYQATLNTFSLAVFIVMIALTVVAMIIVGILMLMEGSLDGQKYQEFMSDSEQDDDMITSTTSPNVGYDE